MMNLPSDRPAGAAAEPVSPDRQSEQYQEALDQLRLVNEIFVRSVLAELERERDAPRHRPEPRAMATSAEPAQTRRTAPSYLRGIPASVWRRALTRHRPATTA